MLASCILAFQGVWAETEENTDAAVDLVQKAGIVGQVLAFSGGMNGLQLSESEKTNIAAGLIDSLETGSTPEDTRAMFPDANEAMQARFNVLTNQTGQPDPLLDDIAFTIGHMTAQFSGLTGYAFSQDELEALESGFLASLGLSSPSEELLASWSTISGYLGAKEQAFILAEQERNRERNINFFEQLRSDDLYQSDDSGLFWTIRDQGEGDPPTMADSVTVHYRGSLIDGKVFDSSFDRGQPATFSMSGVIPGFSAGLAKVGAGGKISIYIPSNLGYGETPPPGSGINPGDTLIFECELISIQRAEVPEAAPEPGETSIGG